MKRIILPGLFIVTLFASCKKDNGEEQAGAPIRPITSDSKKYVTVLYDYTPAPGQFINTDLGNKVGANSILGNKDHIVSLGAWGGTIVLGFDHTVINRPNMDDITIFGNAFSSLAEPGIVWVMQDDNGNGKPDDNWYELAGSEFDKPGYIRNYSITYTRPNPNTGDVSWTDNQGNSGTVKTNSFHKQAYYPEWITADQYSITGSLLPTSNINDSSTANITSGSFEKGYADNLEGGNAIDIENAIDNNGKKISLKGIDFIKIQTGIQFNLGWLGELSTEISAVADASMP